MVQEDDGTNSPLAHQLIISKLTIELGILYYRQKSISLIPLPETPLNEKPGHAVPDVLLDDDVVYCLNTNLILAEQVIMDSPK